MSPSLSLRAQLVLGFALLTGLIVVLTLVCAAGYRHLSLTVGEMHDLRVDSLERSEGLLKALETTSPESEMLHVYRDLDRHLRVVETSRGPVRAALSSFGIQLGVLAGAALLAIALLSTNLQHKALRRLSALQAIADAVEQRASPVRAELQGGDELAKAAKAIRTLLSRIEEDRARSEGMANQDRRLLLGLVAQLGPAALYDLDGLLIASSFESSGAAAPRDFRAALEPLCRKMFSEKTDIASETLVETNGRRLRLAPLVLPEKRGVIGWIVRPA